jgi:hypothetical protein
MRLFHVRLGVGVGCCLVARVFASEPFTEEAYQRGVLYSVNNNVGYGTGTVFTDLDLDGDPDIVAVGAADGMVGVYENVDGIFVDRSPTSGMPVVDSACGVSAADYNGDGALDIYFSNTNTPNILMHNDGGWHFSDVTALAGVGDSGPGQGCTWADVDRDGWLDLYLANRTETTSNKLFRNLGDGTFEDVTFAFGVSNYEPTFHANFFDYDLDGWPDLYLCTDHGEGCVNNHNHLFRNTGSGFVEVTTATHTEMCIACMGTAITDIDGNGYPDLYCTNVPDGNVLLLNPGDDGPFVDASSEMGVESFQNGWATAFFDYDNDGHDEIYVTNSASPNRLYDHDGEWPARDIADEANVDVGPGSYTVTYADVDSDGDVDMLVQMAYQPLRMFINHEGDNRNWLTVSLRSNGPNTQGIGARVAVSYQDGLESRSMVREVINSQGFKSTSTLDMHFGVNMATEIDAVTIVWPDQTVQVLSDVDVNQRLIVNQQVDTLVPLRARPRKVIPQ